MEECYLVCLLNATHGDTRLHFAAIQGNLAKLRQYYKKDHQMYLENINRAVKPLGATPLRLAVSRSHISTVEFLVTHGADVNIPDRKGQTPLYHAVLQGSLECVKLLLDAGSCPDGSPLNRTTPIYASMFLSGFCDKQFDIFKMLLRYGGSYEQFNIIVTTPCVLCQLFSTNAQEFFLTMYYESGGTRRECACHRGFDKWLKDEPMASKLKAIMFSPISLKSSCRLAIRQRMGKNLSSLEDRRLLPKGLLEFLNFD